MKKYINHALKVLVCLSLVIWLYISFFAAWGKVETDDLLLMNSDNSIKKIVLIKTIYNRYIGVKFLMPWEINYDLDLLFFALEKAYIGSAETNPEFLKELRSKIEARVGSIKSKKEFTDILFEELKVFDDYHLVSVLRPRSWRRNNAVGKNSAQRNWEIKESSVGKDVPILAFNTFGIIDEDWKIRDQIEKSIKTSRALIIDLRDNTGGHSTIPLYIAGELYQIYAESYFSLPGPLERVDSCYSREHTALIRNYTFSRTYFNRISTDTDASKLIDEVIEMNYSNKSDDKKQTAFSSREKDVHYEKDNFYKKPIVIIQDFNCASACEQFVRTVKYLPNVTTVGTNTMGMHSYGGAGYLILPNSANFLSVSNGRYTYKDGSKEFNGIEPDKRVHTGDAMVDANNLIKVMLDKN